MKIEELKGKKITVMGLGLHGGGIGTVRFLVSAGAKVTVTDIKSKDELAVSLEKLKDLKGVKYVLGQHRPEDFTKADMVIKNPAAPWNNKHIKLALEKKIPVEMDSSLFFKLCKNPIIGVTGTKGKTTTSTLIGEILKVAGKNPVSVGIGQVSVLDKLRDVKPDSWVVFELSSWRASGLGRYKISPKIAVITNIYPDHLNYYGSLEAYIQDKKYVFANQKPGDYCILNWDDKTLNKLEPEIRSQLIKVAEQKISNGKTVFVSDGIIYLNNGIDEKKVVAIADLKIRGDHNVSNILAAIAASFAAGASLEAIRKAVTSFVGVSHRLELIREIAGVKYFNDTTATTPESAISGIKAFTEPIVLICGGADKNLEMASLAAIIQEKVKGVIFLKGVATDKLIAELKKIAPEGTAVKHFTVVETMAKAVELAGIAAEPGDVVLLSPGAASFGLFANEFDRGDKFKEAVKRIK